MILYILLTLGIIIVAVIVYSNVKIDVTQTEICTDENTENMTFLHLSDLHKKTFGKDCEKLFASLPKDNIDGIFFTGDLISRSEREISHKIAFMKRLCEIAPVYFVGGNHEADVPEIYESLCERLKEIGVVVLRNQSVSFEKGEKSITITGLEPEGRFFKNQNGNYKNLPKITEDYLFEKLGYKENNFTILLAHSPFAFEEYDKWGAELVLSGHVHGGVMRLPILGGILSPERKFFPKYSAGMFKKNNATMVVSRGLGKFRIFNPSQIVIIKFKGA